MKVQALRRALCGMWACWLVAGTPAVLSAEAVPTQPAGVLVGPRPVHMAAPEYPSKARRFEVVGTVLVHFAVTTEGATTAVAVGRSSGSNELDAAALAAVTQWRFEPARNEMGDPVAVRVAVPIQFELERSSAPKGTALAASASGVSALGEASSSSSQVPDSTPVYRPPIEVMRPRPLIILAPRGR